MQESKAMDKVDKLDMSIEKLLSQKTGDKFTVNGKWLCKLENDVDTGHWKKDLNSPAMNIEILVDVCSTSDNEEHLAGMVLVQSDVSLSRKYYANLYMRSASDKKWKCMLSIVDIEFRNA